MIGKRWALPALEVPPASLAASGVPQTSQTEDDPSCIHEHIQGCAFGAEESATRLASGHKDDSHVNSLDRGLKDNSLVPELLETHPLTCSGRRSSEISDHPVGPNKGPIGEGPQMGFDLCAMDSSI